MLEILISVSILAIALTIVFKAQSQSIVMAEETKFYATAPFLAQLQLAEAEHNIEEGPDENSGDFGEDMPGYRWQISVSVVDSQVLAEDADPLKRIDVVVSLRGDAFEYRLRKYVIGKKD